MSRTSKRKLQQSGIVGHKGNKLWAEAIRLAVLRESNKKKGSPTNLYKLAEKLVKMGLLGDTSAMREIGDRLDGKAAQAISGPDGEPIKMIMEIEFVDAEDGRPVKKK